MDPPAPSSASQPVTRKSGRRRLGCVVVSLLITGFCGWSWLRLTLPGRLASATHEKIRPGASLRDVVAVADRYWDATGSSCSGSVESFQVFTPGLGASGSLLIRGAGSQGSADREELRFDSKPELLRLFDARPEFLTCRRVGFTFLVTGVPARTSFAVEFGGDGRVIRVTPPHSWD